VSRPKVEQPPIEDMLRDSKCSRQIILTSMPKRSRDEQLRVWAEGLARIASRLAAQANRSAQTIVEHVVGGGGKGALRPGRWRI
jgi:hypothetical protein